MTASRVYRGKHLERVAFPLGGIGAGTICLEGSGALSHVSLRHKPDVFHEPQTFAALYVEGVPPARVLQGPVPMWKAFGAAGAGNGASGKTYGPAAFRPGRLFGAFSVRHGRARRPSMPLRVELTGWSPFVPGDADNSSLPVAALEYRFVNRTRQPAQASSRTMPPIS